MASAEQHRWIRESGEPYPPPIGMRHRGMWKTLLGVCAAARGAGIASAFWCRESPPVVHMFYATVRTVELATCP